MKINFNFDVIMTIWCAFWILRGLYCLAVASTGIGAVVQISCIVFQCLFGVYFALKAKEPFCNFYATIKGKLKK